MKITVGLWIIPVLLTAFFVGMMLRPWKSTGDYDYSFIIRGFWLIPACLVWAVYFGLLVLLRP